GFLLHVDNDKCPRRSTHYLRARCEGSRRAFESVNKITQGGRLGAVGRRRELALANYPPQEFLKVVRADPRPSQRSPQTARVCKASEPLPRIIARCAGKDRQLE